MDYLGWNDAIATNFFRPEMAGRKVFLYVTAELLDRLGRASGADHTEFVEAVLDGPRWVTHDGLCRRALDAFREWRKHDFAYPPYVAYLGLFTLAAGLEGEFAPHAYYPRLRTLIGEQPIIGQYPQFNYMHFLWEDLERWSLEDKAGGLGIFNVILASKMSHVGIPMAQTLLTEAEAASLPEVFARSALDPSFPPSDENLAGAVRVAGPGHLKHRTLDLLASRGGEITELRATLIHILADELLVWDGTVPQVEEEPSASVATARRAQSLAPVTGGDRKLGGAPGEPTDSTRAVRVAGTVRLHCDFDRVSARMRLSVVCRTAHPFPDDGLILHRLDSDEAYACDELAGGWSSHLRIEPGGMPFDGSLLDWTTGAELTDDSGLWQFRLRPGPVRVFVNAQAWGMPGLIEDVRLSPGSPFYLAVRRDCADRIARWGGSSCSGFREFVDVTGMPGGWRFFYSDRANDDEPVRDVFPILAFPRSASLQLEGGLRAEGLNQFFDFAPPQVLLEGATEGTIVVCNGIALTQSGNVGRFALPADAPRGARLQVEARYDGEAIVRRNLWLVGDTLWPAADSGDRFDASGWAGPQPAAGPVFAGALVENLQVAQFVSPPFLELTRCDRVILVGRVPGQIATWPAESVPESWSPVWRIECRGRHGRAFYCSFDGEEIPVSAADTGDRRRVIRWKESLWHWRKRIHVPPDHHVLWKQYLLRARDA